MKIITLITIGLFAGVLTSSTAGALESETKAASIFEKTSELEANLESSERQLNDLKADAQSEEERKLGQIRVEEEKKPKKAVKKRKLVKKADPHAIFLGNIDKMIKEFGLDEKLDKPKVKGYFKGLEDKIYKNLKGALFKQKEYMASYNGVIDQYKKLSEKYNIK